MVRFDERDTIFSRMELVPGSERYASYYASHPELKEIDDQYRLSPPGKYAHDQINMSRVDAAFRFLKEIRPLASREDVTGHSQPGKATVKDMEKVLHETALDYGAVLYGRAVLGLECFYAVRGRGPAYGETVESPLRNALVFAVEMNREKISRAPRPEEAVEVTRAYVQVAIIGMILSYQLREIGYRARCHMDGESELVLPAAAQAAGLGKIGRLGLLLSSEYGPMIRLGAVTTDFPLTAVSPGGSTLAPELEEYCFSCHLCARGCPGKAIPFGNPPVQSPKNQEKQQVPPGQDLKDAPDKGDLLWQIDHEACFSMWKKFGTDCGICVSVCPYGKKST